MADDAHAAFERVGQIKKEESRVLVHPFEGHQTALGTATLGLEFCEQVADLDAVIVPIGGGGLCAGVASAVKLIPQSSRLAPDSRSRRRTLVTGGAGFIGSHLCQALLARGDEVIVLDDLSTGLRANLIAIEALAPGIG